MFGLSSRGVTRALLVPGFDVAWEGGFDIVEGDFEILEIEDCKGARRWDAWYGDE
jgi:hypothetical protein